MNPPCRIWVPAAWPVIALFAAAMHGAQAEDLAEKAPSNVSLALEEKIQPLAQRHDGDVAIGIRVFKGQEEIGSYWHNPDQPMPTASLIKIPVMVEVFRQIEAGDIQSDETTMLREEDKVPGSGILTEHFSAGSSLRLGDLVRLMIRYSDNTATNLLIESIGLESTTRTMQKLGCPATQLHSQVYRRSTSMAPKRSQQFGLGSTTAREMVTLLTRLHQGQLVSPAASKQMLEHLRNCEDRSKLGRYLPADVGLANKSGAISRVRTDAGILTTDGFSVAICVLTANNADQSWGDGNQAEILCGRVAVAALSGLPKQRFIKESNELQEGSTGFLVEALQRTLNDRIATDLSVDGDFGPATLAAVREFQMLQGIEPSGRVTTETWQALGELRTADEVRLPDEINAEVLSQTRVLDPTGPPAVSCKAWCAVDVESGRMIGGHRAAIPLPMASTTKIMTALVVMQYLQAHPEALDETLEYSRRADETVGSTSGVRAGERLPVREALYGLLLPSGNDASIALAEHFADRVDSGEEPAVTVTGGTAKHSLAPDAVERFVRQMNATAKRLGMHQTRFMNTHGLTQAGHESSPADLAILAREALRDPLFRSIVATRQRGCRLESADGYSRNVVWKNTNRLLSQEGFLGVKTGTTSAAGACLVSLSNLDGVERIVVSLGSSSSDNRYMDARNLHSWAARQK